MKLDLNESNQRNAGGQAIREAIQDIAVGPNRGRDISRERAFQVMQGVLSGNIDEVQTAVFLIAMRMKRESIGEFLGMFDAMLATVNSAKASVDDIILLADPFDGYSRSVTMTPFVPAVLAACGHHVVIHGVESVGPKHGVTAHKVFNLAGKNTDLSANEVAQDISAHGWGYVDQSCYAPALFALQNLRDRIVKRTALTTLERLLMPIQGRLRTHLVLGYVHKAYPQIYATVANRAGYETVLLLKGVEGGLAPALNKPLRRFFFNDELPDDVNAEKQLVETQALFDSPSAAQAVDPSKEAVFQCLETGLSALSGAKSVAQDSLCLASAQILTAHQSNLTLPAAVEKVRACLDNGSAKAHFDAAILKI